MFAASISSHISKALVSFLNNRFLEFNLNQRGWEKQLYLYEHGINICNCFYVLLFNWQNNKQTIN